MDSFADESDIYGPLISTWALQCSPFNNYKSWTVMLKHYLAERKLSNAIEPLADDADEATREADGSCAAVTIRRIAGWAIFGILTLVIQ